MCNENSTTTRVRVVFDASSKTSSGVSLNDKLKIGPKIQDDIFIILLSFRKDNVVLTADISKMYRQILVKEEQQNLQRIIWRENETDPLMVYKLRTVTYGTGPASFLATRCLKQIALENEKPEISKIISRIFDPLGLIGPITN